MKSSAKNIIIVLLVIIAGFFIYRSNNYKNLYEGRLDWTPPSFCSDEHSKNINFLLNTYDSRFHEARVVTALKDSGCFNSYPSLIESAQAVIDKENEVVRVINDTDIATVELIVEFEKDPLQLNSELEEGDRDMVVDLIGLVTNFENEMDKRTQKELHKYFE